MTDVIVAFLIVGFVWVLALTLTAFDHGPRLNEVEGRLGEVERKTREIHVD